MYIHAHTYSQTNTHTHTYIILYRYNSFKSSSSGGSDLVSVRTRVSSPTAPRAISLIFLTFTPPPSQHPSPSTFYRIVPCRRMTVAMSTTLELKLEFFKSFSFSFQNIADIRLKSRATAFKGILKGVEGVDILSPNRGPPSG